MSHSNVFINIRRALVPFTAVRALEPWLLPAVVLHVSLQCLLVSIAGIASGTVIRHFPRLPEGSVFVFDLVLAATVIHPQDVHDTGVVGLQVSSYEQEEEEPRLVWITNTGRAWRNCGQNRKERNRRHDKGRWMSKRRKRRDFSRSHLRHHNRRDARSSKVERGPQVERVEYPPAHQLTGYNEGCLEEERRQCSVRDLIIVTECYIHQKNLERNMKKLLFAVDSSGIVLLCNITCCSVESNATTSQ